MYTRGFIFFLCSLAILLSAMKSDTLNFQIEPGSKLQIKGTSNVTDFTCLCLESFPKTKVQVVATEDAAKATFSNTVLQIRTKKLDCGNKPMNNDMYSTLKADDHPHIQIELIETRHSSGKLLRKAEEWQSIEAIAHFSIAGVTRKESLSVHAKKITDSSYRFKSSKTILFTDYGIKPPRALMGLIKVDNEISLELDLMISVEAPL